MKRSFFLFLIILLSSIIFPAAFAQEGASLFIEPQAGTFTVGSTFSVSVFINTNGNSVNAIEADLKFDHNKLQVVSPTTKTSLFKIWVEVPTYSNSQGTINLKGGIPSPGIITSKGLVTAVSFRVKSTGSTTIIFTGKSQVLANDGKGTDILTTTTGALVNLILPPLAGPAISSPTHPDQNSWSNNNNPLFVWDSDPGVTGFSYILNQDAIDVPDNIIDSKKMKIKYEDLEDGIWFFHLKAYSSSSKWGGVSHYQVLIDKTAPADFPVKIEPGARTTSRQPFVFFQTTDNLSGIDRYEIKILKISKPIPVSQETPFFIETTSPFQNAELAPGAYDVIVRAYDKAGNLREVTQTLKIVSSIFQPFGTGGFGVGEAFVISWWLFFLIVLLILLILLFLAYHFWNHHRNTVRKLGLGVLQSDHKVASRHRKLKELRKHYPTL